MEVTITATNMSPIFRFFLYEEVGAAGAQRIAIETKVFHTACVHLIEEHIGEHNSPFLIDAVV